MSNKLATAQEIARTYKTTVAYVYKVASLNHWRKVRDGTRVYYHWDDAGNSLGK